MSNRKYQSNRNYQTRYRNNQTNSRRYQPLNRKYEMNADRPRRQAPVYPPLQVQADQKQVIIDHLQQQLMVLRNNQEELHHLQDQYKSLEHRFKLLQDQKLNTDNQFKSKHDLALKTIHQFKTQLENLKSILKQKNIELNHLHNDQTQLLRSLDHLKFTIQQLKSQLKSLLADCQESLNEKNKLQMNAGGVKKDNQILIIKKRQLQKDNDNTMRKLQQMNNYLSKLQIEEKILRDKILGFQNQNNQIDDDINCIIDDLADKDTQIATAQHQLMEIQNDIASTSAASDKYKSQSVHYQKSTQIQALKNNDLVKSIHQAQNTHKLRVNQIMESQKQLQNLKEQNKKLNNINSNLSSQVQQCKKHIQNILLLNSDLVLNLQKYTQQDDVVSTLINRKPRVVKARRRIQQAGVIYKQNIYPEATNFKTNY